MDNVAWATGLALAIAVFACVLDEIPPLVPTSTMGPIRLRYGTAGAGELTDSDGVAWDGPSGEPSPPP